VQWVSYDCVRPLVDAKEYERLHKELLSDWTQETYTLAALEAIQRDFNEVYGFGTVHSIKRTGFSTLPNPPRYPPGSYASVVFSVRTSKNDFIAYATVGWQDSHWKIYEYNLMPSPASLPSNSTR
jgi:hypothetical protein